MNAYVSMCAIEADAAMNAMHPNMVNTSSLLLLVLLGLGHIQPSTFKNGMTYQWGMYYDHRVEKMSPTCISRIVVL